MLVDLRIGSQILLRSYLSISHPCGWHIDLPVETDFS